MRYVSNIEPSAHLKKKDDLSAMLKYLELPTTVCDILCLGTNSLYPLVQKYVQTCSIHHHQFYTFFLTRTFLSLRLGGALTATSSVRAKHFVLNLLLWKRELFLEIKESQILFLGFYLKYSFPYFFY